MRVVPPDECFETGQRQIVERNDRLIVKLKFLFLDRRAKIGLKLHKIDGPGVHSLVEDHIFLFGVLCVIHRDVGIAQNVFCPLVKPTAKSYSDTCAREDIPTIQRERLSKALCHLVREANDVSFAFYFGNEDGEFVPAEAPDCLTLAHNIF